MSTQHALTGLSQAKQTICRELPHLDVGCLPLVPVLEDLTPGCPEIIALGPSLTLLTAAYTSALVKHRYSVVIKK